MDSAAEVARRFEDILERCSATGRPDHLSQSDKVIYYIVAVRCEIDMNGFDSVLDQLLTETELDFLCASLDSMNEDGLAIAWRRIASLLKKSVGHKPSGSRLVSSLPLATRQELGALAEAANSNDRLWHLDEKLATL